MKINEVQLNEYDWFRLFKGTNDVGSSYLSKGPGETTTGHLTKNIYIKDFVNDAVTGLESAVDSGQVNVGSQTPLPATPPSSPEPADQTTSTGTAPSGTVPAVNRKPGQTATQYRSQQKSNEVINAYIKNMADKIKAVPEEDQPSKIKLAKELVNFIVDRKNYPEFQNALKTVELAIGGKTSAPRKFGKSPTSLPFSMSGSGINPDAANNLIKSLRAGQPVKESIARWQAYYINQLLEKSDITWKQAGYILLESNNNYFICDRKYYDLENIFEDIITEDESVSSWLNKFFTRYMRNVNLKGYEDLIRQRSQEVEAALQKSNGNVRTKEVLQALQKLGNAGYSITMSDDNRNAPDVTQSTQATQTIAPAAVQAQAQAAAPSTSKTKSSNSQQIAMDIETLLSRLQQVDPSLHSNLIKSLTKPATPEPTRPGPAAAAPPSQPSARDDLAAARAARMAGQKSKKKRKTA